MMRKHTENQGEKGRDWRTTQRRYSEPLIDVRAVAEMCGVSVWLLYKMAGNGRMPKPIKIGRLLRWKRRDVERWIAGGCRRVASKKIQEKKG